MPHNDLDGAVVVITGGARGIGRETAHAFADRGARVVIGDLDGAAALASAEAIGRGARGLDLDVSSQTSYERFLGTVRDEVGAVDILVNNAGIMPVGAFTQNQLKSLRATIDINLWGVILGCHLVLPGMLEHGRGQVVNVASVLGRVAGGGVAAYSASKFGVVGFTHALQQELRGTGVTAAVVLPGVVRTDLSSGVSERGVPVSGPAAVAAAIVKTTLGATPDATVPRWSGALMRTLALLPPRIQQPLLRAVDYDRAMRDVDTAARAEYRDRLAGTVEAVAQ
ncbi:SDR family NAD(P)-dependent oxidoreductase [Mycobacterium sp. ITM-2016-00317]|uniref:SDR family NAD(P)-dependent oxidoreductase n=1 Tax=Mycobacterium sp. ITM-2016-00317 TaxID=2099694 RepID=UPI00287F8B9C|nr:SDR family NAD(P)-dependent oxidoreductase [Mycobacterium sp. ITM-2016-00317]WNG85740.1 SDR family NAD(P)-dependent oxidoreductase [Mycobacterium sp. ITM-2016-00317]